MKNWFKGFIYLSALVATTWLSSCDNTPPTPTSEATFLVDSTEIAGKYILSGKVNQNYAMRANRQYILRGFVYVEAGATLDIEKGTIIMGEKSTRGALIIKPGGKIMAVGTPNAPIVFTSDRPAGKRNHGDWGGLVICGKAPVNTSSGTQEVEGVPGTTYGGTDAMDNSGVLQYVRIEFAGIPYEADKEINGLTFGGVGSGTTVDHIQVSYCGDDSYEWFGGSVNAKYLVAYKGWDDEFDTDYGFRGKLQFLVGIRDSIYADKSASNGFESDNDAAGSSNNPFTQPIFSNVTLIGPFTGVVNNRQQANVEYTTTNGVNGAIGGKFQAAMHLRRNSKLHVYNSIFLGWPYGVRTSDSKGAANAEAVISHVILAGMWKNFHGADDQSKFENNTLSNKTFNSTFDIISNNNEFWRVNASNVSGASFTGLDMSWFTTTSYKGAFDGTNNWTEGWCNFDPQKTIY